METAKLLSLGRPQVMSSLNSFFNNFTLRETQTTALHRWIKQRLMDDQAAPSVLVTHHVNISALTRQGVASGEFVVVTVEDDTLKVLASVGTALR